MALEPVSTMWTVVTAYDGKATGRKKLGSLNDLTEQRHLPAFGPLPIVRVFRERQTHFYIKSLYLGASDITD